MTEKVFSSNELERYSRQSGISGWDQEKLKSAFVTIVGIGGIGCTCATYLSAAGIGKIRIIDNGYVERSNLNRQVLYTEIAIGALKVQVAAARLKVLNPDIEIEPIQKRLTTKNADELLSGSDIVIDGLDNNETRIVLNDWALKTATPYVYGAIQGWEGYVSVLNPPDTACLSCFQPGILDKDDEKKLPEVPGTSAGLTGLSQALETIKMISGIQNNLRGKLLILDTFYNRHEVIALDINEECPVCRIRTGEKG